MQNQVLLPGFHNFGINPRGTGEISNRAAMLNPTAVEMRLFHPVIFAAGLLEVAAVVGTNEVQRITRSVAATGGTFTISWNGQTTAAIAHNATASDIQAAMEALSNIGGGNVLVTGGPINAAFVQIEYRNALSGTNVAALTTDDTGLTGGGDNTVTTDTAGVLGRVTSGQLAGFSNEWENGPVSNWGREFAMAPIELDLPFGGRTATGVNRQIKYIPAKDRIHMGGIDLTVAVSRALIDTDCDIGWDPGNQTAYLRTASAAGALAHIVGIVEDDLGVYGGRVFFVVPPAKTQYEG
jgi:hypothetical protein